MRKEKILVYPITGHYELGCNEDSDVTLRVYNSNSEQDALEKAYKFLEMMTKRGFKLTPTERENE